VRRFGSLWSDEDGRRLGKIKNFDVAGYLVAGHPKDDSLDARREPQDAGSRVLRWGGIPDRNLDPKIVERDPTPNEKQALVEFLKALEGAPIRGEAPTVFPQ